MKNEPPSLIAIDHDDYHASQVGRTADGRQFFATTPFVGTSQKSGPGHEFIAVYLFDEHGRLLEARIDDLGDRESLDNDRAAQLLEQRIGELGPLRYGRILVQPFEIERFGFNFGLIPRLYACDDGERWVVELQPGNFMAFYEPWDRGVYDT